MRYLFMLSLLLLSQLALANETMWSELEASYQFRTAHSDEGESHTARKMHLDLQTMQAKLTASSKGIGTKQLITLPSPDGELLIFIAETVSVMSPALAER